MIMNERIQELITAYLHRGSTPDQERELFEACKKDPETAEHLRQHLILSLKLRSLRDGVTVDDTLHSAVADRIAALAGQDANLPQVEDAPRAGRDAGNVHGIPQPRRFGFRHVLGSAFAAAAAVVLFFFLLPEDNDSPSVRHASFQPSVDTVIVVKRDTVLQVREVSRPVYIVRRERVTNDTERSAVADHRNDFGSDAAEQMADAQSGRDTSSSSKQTSGDRMVNGEPNSGRTGDDPQLQKPAESEPPSADGTEESVPLYAQVTEQEQRIANVKARNYIEQYNAMLVSVESVQLTKEDRITY